ncbi:MAG: gliding motility-associated C-terminal domain-containing protein [Chitinophagales bacterium]|nr:gliding motility-associated C-terminal domain-containing protein [Chitinophagales bacterium]MDW8418862.1 gliding motility-associated C-terminal domain-containing protein [Chitinophagales bacterium]
MHVAKRCKLLLVIAFYFSYLTAHSQPSCPSINAGSNQTLPCGTTCTNLTATYFQVGSTTSYVGGTIPYTPFSYTAGNNILVNQDDIWSSIINLPFNFCFFGNSYNQLIVGANGLISFDVTKAGNFCQWNTTTVTGFPDPTFWTTHNSIMGVYHDIDPSLGGNIRYQIIGSAPCRIFVVSWNNVPMYDDIFLVGSCWNVPRATHQIAIYETTNVIEIYIQNKSACTGWNNGLATLGIQNATGTVAYTAPGWNNSVWNAQNVGYRFTPNGPSIVSVDWLQGGNVIGTGPTVNVCPTAPTTYTARATYTPCAGGTPVVVTSNVTITPNTNFQAIIDSFKNVTCNGANNGAAYAHVSGGLPPVNYGWSNAPGQTTITGLSPGTYTFTASDGSGCNISNSVTITQPPPLVVNVPNQTQTNCTGTGTGTLTATVTGGNYPYNYVWSGSAQTDSILDNVNAGPYTVTVTDSKGCTATASGTLTIQVGGNTINLQQPVINHVTCFGGNNGSITASASGGGGPLSYTWSNGVTGNTINNLTQGSYTLTVNDGAGCTVSATYNVTQPPALTLNQPTIVNIGCSASSTGSITANPSGGTPQYTYAWTNQTTGQNYSGQTISGLAAGTYLLTVTDNNACTATASYQVTSTPFLTFTQSQTDVSCYGGNDGSATIQVTSGQPPIQYNWNGNGNTTNNTLQGLSAGIVNVTISDFNQCTATATFTITQPSPIAVNLVSQNNVSCYGGSNGSVQVIASGGTPGYSYTWNTNPQQTNPTATNLVQGNYVVTVTDANNCSATFSTQITQPAAMSLTTTAIDATCYAGGNGSASATVQGGTPPYQYLWSDTAGQTTAQALWLSSNVYYVSVTDANGCTATGSAFVNEPSEMIVQTSATAVKCPGDENGSISITATGGNPPYNFSVTQDFANFIFTTDGVAQGLKVGWYNVVVSDNNGCTKVLLEYVPDALPDNFITYTDSTSCYGPAYNDGSAHIIATTLTNGPYTYSIDGGPEQLSGDFYFLSAGQHTIKAVNNYGCVSEIPVLVLEPLPIIVDVIPDTLELTLGETQQVQTVFLNATNVTYQWENTLGLSCSDCPNPYVTAYQTGNHVIVVSERNGNSVCSGSATLHVKVLPKQPLYIPNAFSPNGDGNNDVFMIYGQGIGSVDLTIFNRWGELVFESNNQFDGWDGTYKGVMQNPDVYAYYARITYLDGKKVEKRGSVTLVR